MRMAAGPCAAAPTSLADRAAFKSWRTLAIALDPHLPADAIADNVSEIVEAS